MANVPKIQKALYPHNPKIDPSSLSRIPLNIPYPFKFLANIPVSLNLTFRSQSLVYRKINRLQEATLILRKNIYVWLLLREDTARTNIERLLPRLLQPIRA